MSNSKVYARGVGVEKQPYIPQATELKAHIGRLHIRTSGFGIRAFCPVCRSTDHAIGLNLLESINEHEWNHS